MSISGNNTRRPYKIGVLINQFRDKYPGIIWKCLRKIAAKNNIDLIMLVGNSINSPYENYKEHNIIYKFVDKSFLDGIIFIASIGTFIKHSEYEKFICQFSDLPCVSLSIKIDNITNILIDNRNGIKDAVRHCVEFHGYKRIAFIRGPEGHKEADERYWGYVESLQDYKIKFDPSLVMQGNYVIDSGKREVEKLLRSNKKVDVIISSNDDMALGAINAIMENGLCVPDDIAVIGFDDWEETRFHIPSISSVKQPFEQQIECAINALTRQISSGERSDDMVLPAKLMPRHSCGCFSQEPVENKNFSNSDKTGNDDDFINMLDLLIKQILKIKSRDYSRLKVNRLITSLRQALKEKNGIKLFLNSLFYVLVNTGINDENIQLWQMMLTMLKQKTIECTNDIETVGLIKDIFYQSNLLIAKLQESSQANERFLLKNNLLGLHAVSQDLITQFNFEELFAAITSQLPALNINNFYVLLYKGKVEKLKECSWNLPQSIEIALAIKDKKPETLPINTVKTAEVLSLILNEKSNGINWIIMPLFFHDEHFGLILFEAGQEEGIIYETLRTQISSAIKGAMILEKEKMIGEELIKTNHELKSLSFHDELTGLYNRRGFFALSDELCKLSNRTRQGFVLLFLDLDNLKKINDTYGHKEGDYILRVFSDILKSQFRESDIICRMGGDEFIVLAYNSLPDSVGAIQDKLDKAIEEYNLKNVKPYKLSTSTGVACFDACSPMTMDEMISIADKALYRNKFEKKNITS